MPRKPTRTRKDMIRFYIRQEMAWARKPKRKGKGGKKC